MNQILQRPTFKEPLDLPPGNLLRRGLTAKVLASYLKTSPAFIAAEMWPSDRELAAVYKATSTSATTFTVGWAAELAQKRVADAVTALGAAAAAIDVMANGLLLSWDNAGSIFVPAFVADANHAGFVKEGDPILVRQFVDTAQSLLPYKVASICVLTREMLMSSNAEALISDALVRSAALAIDSAFFDANPAVANTRPAGIRNGISALTASSNTDAFGAVFEDINALVGSVAPVGGRGPFYIISGAGHMSSMKGRFDFEGSADSPMIPVISAGVGNDIICVAAQAIASAVDVDPDVEAANAGVLVMDTAPGAAGTTGSGEKSIFQTDSIAIKVRWPVSWALRDVRGVSWLTPSWK